MTCYTMSLDKGGHPLDDNFYDWYGNTGFILAIACILVCLATAMIAIDPDATKTPTKSAIESDEY